MRRLRLVGSAGSTVKTVNQLVYGESTDTAYYTLGDAVCVQSLNEDAEDRPLGSPISRERNMIDIAQSNRHSGPSVTGIADEIQALCLSSDERFLWCAQTSESTRELILTRVTLSDHSSLRVTLNGASKPGSSIVPPKISAMKRPQTADASVTSAQAHPSATGSLAYAVAHSLDMSSNIVSLQCLKKSSEKQSLIMFDEDPTELVTGVDGSITAASTEKPSEDERLCVGFSNGFEIFRITEQRTQIALPKSKLGRKRSKSRSPLKRHRRPHTAARSALHSCFLIGQCVARVIFDDSDSTVKDGGSASKSVNKNLNFAAFVRAEGSDCAVTCGSQGHLSIWNLQRERGQLAPKEKPLKVTHTRFSESEFIRCVIFNKHNHQTRDMEISNDNTEEQQSNPIDSSSELLALTKDGNLCVFNMSDLSLKKWLSLRFERAFNISLHQNSILVCGSPLKIRVFDAMTLKHRGTVPLSTSHGGIGNSSSSAPTSAATPGITARSGRNSSLKSTAYNRNQCTVNESFITAHMSDDGRSLVCFERNEMNKGRCSMSRWRVRYSGDSASFFSERRFSSISVSLSQCVPLDFQATRLLFMNRSYSSPFSALTNHMNEKDDNNDDNSSLMDQLQLHPHQVSEDPSMDNLDFRKALDEFLSVIKPLNGSHFLDSERVRLPSMVRDFGGLLQCDQMSNLNLLRELHFLHSLDELVFCLYCQTGSNLLFFIKVPLRSGSSDNLSDSEIIDSDGINSEREILWSELQITEFCLPPNTRRITKVFPVDFDVSEHGVIHRHTLGVVFDECDYRSPGDNSAEISQVWLCSLLSNGKSFELRSGLMSWILGNNSDETSDANPRIIDCISLGLFSENRSLLVLTSDHSVIRVEFSDISADKTAEVLFDDWNTEVCHKLITDDTDSHIVCVESSHQLSVWSLASRQRTRVISLPTKKSGSVISEARCVKFDGSGLYLLLSISDDRSGEHTMVLDWFGARVLHCVSHSHPIHSLWVDQQDCVVGVDLDQGLLLMFELTESMKQASNERLNELRESVRKRHFRHTSECKRAQISTIFEELEHMQQSLPTFGHSQAEISFTEEEGHHSDVEYHHHQSSAVLNDQNIQTEEKEEGSSIKQPSSNQDSKSVIVILECIRNQCLNINRNVTQLRQTLESVSSLNNPDLEKEVQDVVRQCIGNEELVSVLVNRD